MSIEIETVVNVDAEVVVSVGLDDIVAALPSKFDDVDAEGLPSRFTVSRGINNCYEFMASLEEKHLLMLSQKARAVISKAFSDIAEKLESVKDIPDPTEET